MSKLYTHTVIEHQYFRVTVKDGVPDFEYIPQPSERGLPLAEQIRAWVDATGHIIRHPGQIGLHKEQFHNGTILCVTLAQSILYEPSPPHDQPASAQHSNPNQYATGRGA